MFVGVLLRIIGAIILGLVGWRLGLFIANWAPGGELIWIVALALVGAAVGFAFTPGAITRFWRWVEKKIRQIPAPIFIAAVIGLVLALLASALLALPLSLLPGLWGKVLPFVLGLLLCYLGISIMVHRSRDVFQPFNSAPLTQLIEREHGDGRIILDTNAIIDGRIADISQTGFIRETLLIPRFVLNELQHIADSPDPMRRMRGRRGLSILTKMQRESDVPVQVLDTDFEDIPEVDAKLVKLAKSLRCSIITNDINLSRVAELQGIRVLNINELANAIKPVILPGEEMRLRIVQEGKEAGQGIGFLDDGTMVVVEGARRHLNAEIDIVVTRVLQTAAGRMIFAHPRELGNERKR
jgi:uncharacterized protein YacL